MEKEFKALEEKVERFDLYLELNYDPQKPETLHGGEDPKKRAEFQKYADELYASLKGCSKFKTEEEIELRNRALVQLQLIQITENVRQTQMNEKDPVPEKDAPERPAYDAKLEKRDEAMLKYSCAVSGIVKGDPAVSKTIDLDQITWVQTTEKEQLQKSLNSTGIDKIMSLDPDSPLYGLKERGFSKGGLSAYTFLIPRNDGKGYKLDKAKAGEKMLSDVLADAKMKEMISSYQKAEKFYVTSGMSPSQEIENRLRFINAYEKELKTLYFAMNSDGGKDPILRETARKVFEKKGIGELIKDYKTFYDPANEKTNFLVADANEYEKKFRDNYKEIKGKVEGTLPKNDKIKEFHQFLLKNGDYGTGVTGDVTKTEKQVRPFIDNFMALPEKDQLKALYMLENKLYKKNVEVTDEMLKDYEPNVKKATSVMKASNAKFWKRANTSYIYWQKLKTCVDKVVYDVDVPEQKKKSKSAIALKVGKIATKISSVVARLGGKVPQAGALTAASAVLGSAGAIANMAKEKDLTSGAQKADVLLGEAGKFTKSMQMNAMINVVTTKNLAYMQAFQGLAIATNAINTGKSIANIVTSKKNVNKVADLNKEITDLLKDKSQLTDEQTSILEKLKTNTKVLKVINRDKVKIATCETVKNSTALVSSTLMATGVGAAALIPQVVVGIGTKIAENKIKSQNTLDVIDAKFYKDEADKQQKMEKARTVIIGRYARMPEKLRDKYADQVNDVISSKKKMAAQLRQEAVRKSGQINLQATKNSYIREISSDVYHLLKTGAEKMKEKPLSKVDQKIMELANKFVVATGGKAIDVKKLQIDSPQQSKQQEQRTIERMSKNMSL